MDTKPKLKLLQREFMKTLVKMLGKLSSGDNLDLVVQTVSCPGGLQLLNMLFPQLYMLELSKEVNPNISLPASSPWPWSASSQWVSISWSSSWPSKPRPPYTVEEADHHPLTFSQLMEQLHYTNLLTQLEEQLSIYLLSHTSSMRFSSWLLTSKCPVWPAHY